MDGDDLVSRYIRLEVEPINILRVQPRELPLLVQDLEEMVRDRRLPLLLRCGVWLGSELRKLESLGVRGRGWETSGDTNSGRWKGREYSRVVGRIRGSLQLVEVVLVYTTTHHLCLK